MKTVCFNLDFCTTQIVYEFKTIHGNLIMEYENNHCTLSCSNTKV